MKTRLLIFSLLLQISFAEAQIYFTNVECTLKLSANDIGTEINYKDSSLSMKFQLSQKKIQKLGENFINVDSQIVQITTLAINELKKDLNSLNDDEQKNLLNGYVQYELDYFKEELKLEIINPRNQWVPIGSRKWFIWYFRLGKVNENVEKVTQIQLFASTIIGGKILNINTPIMSTTEADFSKAGLIVNHMMESLTIIAH